MKIWQLSIIAAIIVTILLGWWLWIEQDKVLKNKLPETPKLLPNAHPEKSESGTKLTVVDETAQLPQTIPTIDSEKNQPLLEENTYAEIEVPEIPKLVTVTDRQRYYKELVVQTPDVIVLQWQNLLEEDKNPNARNIAARALADRLQGKDSQDIYPIIASLLQRPDLSSQQKILVVELLGKIATKSAMQILLDNATNNPYSSFRSNILSAIDDSTLLLWGNRFHPELSPALETAWQTGIDNDDHMLTTRLSIAIARVGNPSGIHLLLNTIEQNGKTLEEIGEGGNPEALAALSAMRKISNPDAIAVLKKALYNYELNDAVYIASGEALATMGWHEATAVLLNWAKKAPDEAAPLAKRWFSQARDTKSINLIDSTLKGDDTFNSDLVKTILAETLKRIE